MVGLNEYLILSAVLFMIGAVGVLTRSNGLILFMSLELMLNAVNLTLVAFSRYTGRMDGHVYVFLVNQQRNFGASQYDPFRTLANEMIDYCYISLF